MSGMAGHRGFSNDMEDLLRELRDDDDKLDTLNFCGSQIGMGDTGARALSKALEANGSLTELDLFDTDIKVAGAEALGKVLGLSQSLRMLDLGGNEIGPAGLFR